MIVTLRRILVSRRQPKCDDLLARAFFAQYPLLGYGTFNRWQIFAKPFPLDFAYSSAKRLIGVCQTWR